MSGWAPMPGTADQPDAATAALRKVIDDLTESCALARQEAANRAAERDHALRRLALVQIDFNRAFRDLARTTDLLTAVTDHRDEAMRRATNQYTRAAIQWFCAQQERILRKYDDKPCWSNALLRDLMSGLAVEVLELFSAIDTADDNQWVIDEAVDVANFAMMIADKYRENPSTNRGRS